MLQLSFLIAGIVLGIVTYYSAKEVIPKFNKLQKAIFYICLVFLSIIPSIQYLIQNKQDEEKECLRKKEEDGRAAKLKEGFDESLNMVIQNNDKNNSRTISNIANILGEYGFSLDSTNKRLIKLIKDSSKTRVAEKDDPIFTFSYDQAKMGLIYKNDSGRNYNYDLTFISKDASSCCYDLKLSTVIIDNLGKRVYAGRISLFPMNERVAKNDLVTQSLFIADYLNYDSLYLWVRGTYKNSDESKTYSDDVLYYHIKSSGIQGHLIGFPKQQIVDFIKLNE